MLHALEILRHTLANFLEKNKRLIVANKQNIKPNVQLQNFDTGFVSGGNAVHADAVARDRVYGYPRRRYAQQCPRLASRVRLVEAVVIFTRPIPGAGPAGNRTRSAGSILLSVHEHH